MTEKKTFFNSPKCPYLFLYLFILSNDYTGIEIGTIPSINHKITPKIVRIKAHSLSQIEWHKIKKISINANIREYIKSTYLKVVWVKIASCSNDNPRKIIVEIAPPAITRKATIPKRKDIISVKSNIPIMHILVGSDIFNFSLCTILFSFKH